MTSWRTTVATISLAVMIAFLSFANAHAEKQLKVNLVMDNNTIMIYAGTGDGIKVGDKFTVMRGDMVVGAAEITRVEATYCLAKVTAKGIAVKDMDTLVPGTGSGVTKSEPTETKEEKPKEEKKTEKKEEKAAEKKEEKAAEKKEEKSVEKKEEKEEKKAEPPKTEKKAESPPPAKPRQPKSSFTYPSLQGPTGLFQIMTAETAPKGSGGLSYFQMRRSDSAKGSSLTDPDDIGSYSFISGMKMDYTNFAVVYGLDQKLELNLSQATAKDSLYAVYSDTFNPATTTNVVSRIRLTSIGVKYNPQKRFMLQPTTTKKFKYALGLERIKYDVNVSAGNTLQAPSSSTMFYGVITMPMKKFKFHAAIYHFDRTIGSSGKHWGSLLGLELPLSTSISLISDLDVFRGTQTSTAGLRYYVNENYAASIGVFDLSQDPTTMFNLSFRY